MQDNTDYTSKQKRAKRIWFYIVLMIVAVALAFIFFRFEDAGKILSKIISVFTPVFYGIAIAYILNPVVTFFERLTALIAVKLFKAKTDKYKNAAKNISIVLALLVLLAAIWVLIDSVLPQLYHTIIALINYVPSGLDKIKEIYESLAHDNNSWLASVGLSFDSLLESIEQWFTESLSSAVDSVLRYVTSGVVVAVSFVANFVIGICVAVYLLKEKSRIFAHIKKITYAFLKKDKADDAVRIGVHAKNIFNGYIYGTLIGCIIVFAATFVFMLIMGMPYAILISALVCVTNFIPFFGPFIGAVPSILILLLHDPIMALTFTIFTLALQQIEGHFITPLIISDTTGVSPFWVTVALLVGGGLFGIIGLILSVPIFSVIYYIIKTLVEQRLANKTLPVSTEAYIKENDFEPNNVNGGKLSAMLKNKKKRIKKQ